MTRSIEVLIIDDDPDDYFLTRELFEELDDENFVLTWKDTYEAGRDALFNGRPDLCLLDFSLGAMTGLDLLREAAAQGCKIPILFLTNQSDRELAVEVMKAGAADYLVKGKFGAQQLERAIRYSLERSRSLHALQKLNTELQEEREKTRDLEIIRKQNEALDRLTTELEAARRTAEARAHELAVSNERLCERERENQELIVRLRDAVAQLSTPILRVWHDVLALPIIGRLDKDRASAMTTRTLQEIAAQRVRYVVLDLTGVEHIDTETVEHLQSLARGARLMGVQCFACGMSPALVRTMVHFGISEHSFAAIRDLHETLLVIASQRAGSAGAA